MEGIPFEEQKGARLALLSMLKRWNKLKYIPFKFVRRNPICMLHYY